MNIDEKRVAGVDLLANYSESHSNSAQVLCKIQDDDARLPAIVIKTKKVYVFAETIRRTGLFCRSAKGMLAVGRSLVNAEGVLCRTKHSF